MRSFSTLIAVILIAACAATGCTKKPDKAAAPAPVDTTLTTEPDPSALMSEYAKQISDCEEGNNLSHDQSLAACGAAGITSMKLEFIGYCELIQGGSVEYPAKTQFAKCLTTPESSSAPKEVQDLLLEWAAPAVQCGEAAPISCPETIAAEKALFAKGWCQTDNADIFKKPIPQWGTCPPNATFDDPYEQESGDIPDSEVSESPE